MLTFILSFKNIFTLKKLSTFAYLMMGNQVIDLLKQKCEKNT